MTKKKHMGPFCKGDKAEQEGLGRSAEGWDGDEVGDGKYGSFQYACLANIICIERLWMEFCVTVICMHLHKINPFPIATEIVSDAENKSTK